MSKLRSALIFVVAVMLLLTAVSCGKKTTEPDDGFPNFQDVDQFWNYVEKFEWRIFMGCEIVGNDMFVWLDLESDSELSEDDTFSLEVNNQAIPVEVFVDYDGDTYIVINNYHDIVLPNSTSLNVKLSRNNVNIANASIRVPSFPSLKELPETVDWTKPVTLKWSLTPNKNNNIQGIWAYAVEYSDDDYDNDEYAKLIDVSARQHTIPANAFSLNEISYYDVGVQELTLKQHGDCILMAACGDYISNDDEEYSRNSERIAERMRKMRF